ncbi:MAG: gamma-glutamyltransferase family protein [Phycisphaerales bacterium]|nr:gamma-glutamyltransferase family protein [Phycisphaerales bacterium]
MLSTLAALSLFAPLAPLPNVPSVAPSTALTTAPSIGPTTMPAPAPGGAAGRFAVACVAADHPAASEAGAEMLRAGGNAVDAAVASAFALSVVRPESCGIGGGGFMVIVLPDDPVHGGARTTIDMREICPRAIDADTFTRNDVADASVHGGMSIATPGSVAGLLLALERYGTLPRERVLEPAIRLAEEGWVADEAQSRVAAAQRECIAERDARDGGAFDPVAGVLLDGVRLGERTRNPDQARALRLIALHGASAFYRADLPEGEIARAILSSVRGAGGVLDEDDLSGYHARELPPLEWTFAGHGFVGMALPSSGGLAMSVAMGILDRIGFVGGARERGLDELGVHRLVESLKHAFAVRAGSLGDSDSARALVALLADERSIRDMAGRVGDHVMPPDMYGPASHGAGHEDGGTSHLCAVDRWGGAVACTQTINTEYGSWVLVEGFGFALNNEVDDFTTRPGRPNAFGLMQSAENAPGPGKRPLSSMSPTIVLDAAGRVRLVAGASGGPRIISGTTHAILDALVLGWDAERCVSTPRVHHQWLPDEVVIDLGPRSTEESVAGMATDLRARGHSVRITPALSVVQIIMRRDDGTWDAACDPRKGGSPAGW